MLDLNTIPELSSGLSLGFHGEAFWKRWNSSFVKTRSILGDISYILQQRRPLPGSKGFSSVYQLMVRLIN